MALRQVMLSATDAAGTANTAAIKAALSALGAGEEGIQLPAGTYNVYATSGSVAPLPVGKSINGADVSSGSAPITRLLLVGSDSLSANVVAPAASGIATGLAVRNLEIDGGRMGGWATGSHAGACVSMAGQNDYSGTPHNAQIVNCRLSNGLTQQTSINSINGITISGLTARADGNPVQTAHGCDFDAVANEKPTKSLLITGCDLDAYGQECLKFENVTDAVVSDTVFRHYASLNQDRMDVYAELARITFRKCTFDGHVFQGALKRRRIPSSSFVNITPSVTVTLAGSNTVGGSLTSTGSFTFTASHVGQAIGWQSGSGQKGMATINSVSAGQIASSTVIEVFTSLSLPAATTWAICGTDNSGGGDVTYDRCTFTENGVIFCGEGVVSHYGTQTLTYNTFHRAGNSYKFPASVAVTATGNLNDGLPVKRFARPATNPKYASAGFDPGTSANAYMARQSCTTVIDNTTHSAGGAIFTALNGEEVWVLNGRYVAAGSNNRDINCQGKTITLRAESPFGVMIDVSGGSGWNAFNQTADVAGHLIWGFVVYGAGLAGGNSSGATITGGDSYMRRMAFLNCKTGNNGPGYRNTTTGTAVLEDYLIANCDAGASAAALYVSQASPIGTITLRRGRVLNNVATGNVAGARLDNANTTVEGLEVAGNVNSASTGGLLITKNATVTNLTCGGNSGAANAHDVNVTSGTTTADSWVCWSDNGGAIKAVNVVTATLTLDKATLFGGSGNVTGAGTKNLTNILSTDPQFADATGGNYQLKATSPSRGVGVQRAGLYDAFNKPFAYDAATANHGAWA